MTIKVYYDYKRKTMKIISFSIWGKDKKYIDGAIENAILTKKIYGNDWISRFYYDQDTVPSDGIEEIKRRGGVTIPCKNTKGSWEGLFWRFYPASDPDVDIMISRDTDSRLNSREKAAVDEWIKSEMCFHIMRDHYQHNVQILGGMWGATKKAIPDMKKLIDEWQAFGYRGCDQDFLASRIYPRIINDAMIHDEVIGDQYGWKEVGRKAWPKHKPIEWGEHVGGYVFERVLKW